MEREAAGTRGTVHYGHQVAATLGAWRLQGAPEAGVARYRLAAEVVALGAYWLAQRPLALTLAVGADTWTWTLPDGVAVVGGRMEADVAGPPVVTRHARPA